MCSSDIHDAIHALGLRRLFSTLSVTGDESVQTTEVVSDPLSGCIRGGRTRLDLIVPVSATWAEPKDTFRKRRWEQKCTDSNFLEISLKTEVYIQSIINSVSSGELASISPPRDIDVLITSWFLGLHFSESISRLSSDSYLEYKFLRSALWYLQIALETYKKITFNTAPSVVPIADENFPKFLSAPWIEGLNAIANEFVRIQTFSSNQAELIKSVCSRFSILFGRSTSE